MNNYDVLTKDSLIINEHDQIITIDMSSPNIAKPMSMEHLRSTLIGNTLSNVLTKQGYKTVKINHIGDWCNQ